MLICDISHDLQTKPTR